MQIPFQVTGKPMRIGYRRKAVLVALWLGMFTVGCGEKADPVEVVHVETQTGCDDLNPLYCPAPWPSDRYLERDETTVTGFRIAYTQEVIPDGCSTRPFNLEPFNRLDGFSPGSQIVTLFASPPDLTDAADHDDIDRSLESDSPIVLVDLVTGGAVPHWAELDARATSPGQTLVYIRPAFRLANDRSYAVAIRGLRGIDGELLAPSEAFRALRDGLPSDSDALEARRPDYEAMFTAFEEPSLGIVREELQAAWWWHTASFESTHGDMLTIREDALERLGPNGIGCTITSVEDDFKSISYRLVRGTVTTPWYLDHPDSPAAMVRDADGVPTFTGTEEVEFLAVLPSSLASSGQTGPLVTWGHGLFGSAGDHILGENMLQLAEDRGFVFGATNWAGMSSDDLGALAGALANVTDFYKLGEHVQQAMVNQMTLTRSLAGACRLLPEMTADGTPIIDPDRLYFVGGSQGSILGGTLLTLSPDITRGALLVGGSTFSFMIERSIHFNTFTSVLDLSCPERIDQGYLMAISQHVWDWAESAGYLPHILEGLPGIGAKELLYIVTKNDAQVPNLCSDLAARDAGLPALEGSVWVPWGVDQVASPYAGSAYVTVDIGDRDPPAGNLSPEVDDGGHVNAATTPEVFEMVWGFLMTGEAVNTCGGTCSFQ
ncbi:MAG: hypothetical protein ABI333_08325 [bacterium]